MTNSFALVLGVALLGAIAYDIMVENGTTLIFLARKMAELIEWLAFWR